MWLLQLPRGTAQVVRIVVAGVPAVVAVTVAVLILFLALFMGERRQRYALRAARCATDLAKSMIGVPPPDTDKKSTNA